MAFYCPGCMTPAAADAKYCLSCSYPRGEGWPTDPFVGRVINDRFRIDRRLGAGAFGLVFLARQIRGEVDLGEVALKFLHRGMSTFAHDRRRFIKEAQAARAIRNPHIVKVFDLDFDHEGIPFMVMEYLVGESLRDQLYDAKALSPSRTLRIAVQVTDALEDCHAAGIIHRDLKPDNLLIIGQRRDDFVKILDFGVARVPSESTQTRASSVAGTPRYMSPEQITDLEIDGRADIFSLGVIIYECLAGRPPIEARNSQEYLEKNLSVDPLPLRQHCPQLPETLETLLAAMMAKERGVRPATMSEVERRLRDIGETYGWLSEETQRIDLTVRPPTLPEEPPPVSAEVLAGLRESARYDFVEHGDRCYHVQTEAIGSQHDLALQTVVMEGGALRHSRSVPYSVKIKTLEDARAVLGAQHEAVINAVKKGVLPE